MWLTADQGLRQINDRKYYSTMDNDISCAIVKWMEKKRHGQGQRYFPSIVDKSQVRMFDFILLCQVTQVTTNN